VCGCVRVIVSHIGWYVSHMGSQDASCHTYERVMSHIWTGHVTHMNGSRHAYELRIRTLNLQHRIRRFNMTQSHVKHMNGSCHTFMSHIWTGHVTHSCHTYELHIRTLQGATSHTTFQHDPKSCHTHTNGSCRTSWARQHPQSATSCTKLRHNSKSCHTYDEHFIQHTSEPRHVHSFTMTQNHVTHIRTGHITHMDASAPSKSHVTYKTLTCLKVISHIHEPCHVQSSGYGVASSSRLLKILGLFCRI